MALQCILYCTDCELHPNIIIIAKRSTTPNFVTVQRDQNVIGLLKILQAICVQNLTSSKVDLFVERLKTLASTLSYVQKKGKTNNKFGDAVIDQVTAAQCQCGIFAFWRTISHQSAE